MPDAIRSPGIGRVSPVSPSMVRSWGIGRVSPYTPSFGRGKIDTAGILRMAIGEAGDQRLMQSGVVKNTTEGSPASPCLELSRYGLFRFRWAVSPGVRTLSVSVKQPSNRLNYPTMTLLANSSVGLGADVVGTSPGGTGWVTIGPLSFTASAFGVVTVEFRNNCDRATLPYQGTYAPCYFDHLVAR